MTVVNSARRYRGLKARSAHKAFNLPIAVVFREKQTNTPGTPLPSDFPYLSKLAASPAMLYECYEDLDGVTRQELSDLGLTEAEANKIKKTVQDYYEGG